MKQPLSETLTELGIAFTSPIVIKDENGNQTYYEVVGCHWWKAAYDHGGFATYYENSDGVINEGGAPLSW